LSGGKRGRVHLTIRKGDVELGERKGGAQQKGTLKRKVLCNIEKKNESEEKGNSPSLKKKKKMGFWKKKH